MDDNNFSGIPDDMPDELKESLNKLKELIALSALSDALLKLGLSSIKLGAESNLEYLFKMGNIIIMLGGICKSNNDILEFENITTEFAAKKLRDVLDKGDENADKLLDSISDEFKGKDRENIFDLLSGKKTVSQIKEERNKGDE